MAQTTQFTVGGGSTIHYEGCEQRIGKALKRLPSVEVVTASHKTQEVSVTFDPAQTSAEQLRATLARAGFETEPDEGIGGASPDRKGLGNRTGSPTEGSSA
ncbi:MAG: heavy-metal-associated domain-containing protein [Dehalococcoidia bacterium]